MTGCLLVDTICLLLVQVYHLCYSHRLYGAYDILTDDDSLRPDDVKMFEVTQDDDDDADVCI